MTTGVLSLGLLIPFGAGTVPDQIAKKVAAVAAPAPAKHVTLVHDGLTESIETHAGTAGDLLAERNLARSPDDAGHLAAADLLDELDALVVYLLNRHLADSARRLADDHGAAGEGAPLCVGFADQVGYTRLSQSLDERQLASLVEQFETVASDAVVAHGGRVVKMIGDEVMFAAAPAAAIEIGLTLADAFGGDDLPEVRVGLACGRVVIRAGDVFGPTPVEIEIVPQALTVLVPGVTGRPRPRP